ncbi:MAG TPA: hypothetical protein P5123_01760 [Spirochaetota bacterium]|nr:hypothetical protein [Spirochaetota bacterium]
MTLFVELMRSMDNRLNELLRNLSEQQSISVILILMLVSFAYGVIHSMGPGHGKALVASFFLKEEHPLRRSLFLAAVISVIHTGSALVIAYLFNFVLTSVRGMFRIKLQGYFIAVSGILIVCVGLFFLIRKFMKKKDEHVRSFEKKGNVFLVGFSAGIVPCPAALMIMMFAFTAGIPLIGLYSVIFISLGMFVLLSVIGTLIIRSRKGIMDISSARFKKSENVALFFEYFSIVAIICIGLIMSLRILI